MAPLLGRKPYPLAKPLAEPSGPGEEVYIIEHTKEAFRNKEYPLTSCSESINQANRVLVVCLLFVWLAKWMLPSFFIRRPDKVFNEFDITCPFYPSLSQLHVHDLDWMKCFLANHIPHALTDTSQLFVSCDRARRSPRKSATATKEEKKRWVMPKFLPHKYDVKLINEDKVISSVPADSLYRTERPPTKEIMRYFIRHYALRLGKGESAPWVVEDDLVKKYNLLSKFSDFLLDPQKMKMNGSPLKVKSSGTPKKGDGKGSVPSTQKSGKKTGDKKDGKKSGKSGDKKLNVLKSSKKDGKAGDKTPKMKQMTLLQLAKGTPTGSPKKRARSTSLGTPKLGKPLHPMALHLIRYYKEHKGKEDKKTSLSSLVSKAAKTLTAEDRGRLPDELKELVQKRWELLEQKKRWAAMSEEERNEEMKRRRAELKEKLREKAKEKRKQEMLVRQEQSRRYEDQEIEDGKALPTFKLVDMPEGLPNTLFGSVAMVVDFLHCYAGLLMPDDQYPITAVALMEALAGDRSGFHYLNRVLVVLLQTLLQDELAEGYSELDMSLSEIPLTMHSASELTRLCLRPCDAHEESGQGSEDSGAMGGYDDVVSSEFLEKLETVEVFELSPEEKVDLLVALCHRILMTYSVEDHVDAMQQRSAELWKERLAMLKEVNDRKKAEKKMRKEMESKGRLLTERMEKEAEEERLRKQKAAAERAFQDGITKAKLVMRRTPLGTDRNHNSGASAMQLSASCPDLRMDVPLRLMESRSRSRQGSSRKLRAGKARCVRQVYIWSRQLGKPTGDDEKLILCDECNKAFHLFCLRPALYRIPAGEWRCPACQPTVARRGSRS
ncbi:hypothetical protein XENOCAPTIV_009254, partial [Xenoophorus captivus]